MIGIDTLDLPFIPVDDPEFAADPFSRFAAARDEHPWLAKCAFAYIPTDYAAIREIMAHDDQMRVGFGDAVDLLGAADTPWGRFVKNTILNEGGETHKRLRAAVAPVFTPRQANANRALMREVMADLLDKWLPKGEFDFEVFASYYPISVMCRVIGASTDAVPHMRRSLEALGAGGSFDGSIMAELQSGFALMDDFVRDLIAQRRARPRTGGEPDLLDRLIGIRNEGGLDEQELIYLLIFLFTAGYDTSRNALTIIMHLMIDRPADYARCAADAEYCRKIVDESLRYFGVASSPRVLMADLVVRDVHIPKGTMLLLPWGMSARDPKVFDDPDSFDPDRRKSATPIIFGLGPHICLGQFIARAQLEEGWHAITRRMAAPRRVGEPGWRTFPGIWGIRGLPIAFSAA